MTAKICVDPYLYLRYIGQVYFVEISYDQIGQKRQKTEFPPFCPIGPYFDLNNLDL